jgi:hypothetical protein
MTADAMMKDEPSQLVRDLRQRIHETLCIWLQDSRDLFRITQLDPDEATLIILYELITATAMITAATTKPGGDAAVLEGLRASLEHARREMKEYERPH